eukprot:5188516-Pleurochrysis_carterae.AAC.1
MLVRAFDDLELAEFGGHASNTPFQPASPPLAKTTGKAKKAHSPRPMPTPAGTPNPPSPTPAAE